ncbi:NAD-dependent epimerase/dehydratase family protein [Aeromicrobium marinum]|nr:NAD-dependent epimerase/dehydratase family protein [Aeromicrobium marinum]
MTDRHLVVGAGPVGRHVAQLLAARGSEVVVATRSGTDTGIDGVQHLALDATDTDALSAAASGSSVLYNCANPTDYTTWSALWPPLAASLLTAAERSGAVLAVTGNLYPYGPVGAPMTESTPDTATDTKGRLRATMWADARAAHEAGRIRAVEVRGSDYVGTGVGDHGHVSRQVGTLRAGKRAWVLFDADQPHTFTDVLDMARLLVAAGADESAWGRVWHAPSAAPRTQRQALVDLARVGDLPEPKISVLRPRLVRTIGAVVPMLKELADLSYQWTAPYVLDDAVSRAHFGLEPTPWDESMRRTLAG